MNITELRLPIRDLIDGYREDPQTDKVTAMSGRLDVRPEFQRSYVYSNDQAVKVINSILHGFPLNSLYFTKREDDSWEVMDGQQRIISICEYAMASGKSIQWMDAATGKLKDYTFEWLPEELKQKFLDYELTVQLCEGTEEEKMDWFRIVNISGVQLSDQEMRNALYHSRWLTDAKSIFSRRGNIVDKRYGSYLKGSSNRQETLATAFYWKGLEEGFTGKRDEIITQYMKAHRNDENANDLWNYIQRVFDWTFSLFPDDPKTMKGVEWGRLYNEHRNENHEPAELKRRVSELMKDYEIKNKSGIYEYLLTDEEKHLNLRTFDQRDKLTAYNRQDGKCAICGEHFEISEMDADHIVPWNKGGKTEPSNLQMLCRKCNRSKGAR